MKTSAFGGLKRKEAHGRAGVVPVKVEMVVVGREFKFERLLVLNQPLTLSVEV